MKKAFYILMTALISFVFLCACEPKNPQDEIVKLNIPKEGVAKFEFLPTELPPTNGSQTTDLNLIDEIIDQLNEHEYHMKIVEGHRIGVGKEVRITYENGDIIEFYDAGVDILKPDGTWLERTDSKFELQKYLVEKLDFKLYPDQTRLHIPEENIESISFIPMHLPDSEVGEMIDPEEIKYAVWELNMVDYCICSTYRSEFPEPIGYLVFKYADGSEIKYAVAEDFLQRSDGVWLEYYNGKSVVSTILANYFGYSQYTEKFE